MPAALVDQDVIARRQPTASQGKGKQRAIEDPVMNQKRRLRSRQLPVSSLDASQGSKHAATPRQGQFVQPASSAAQQTTHHSSQQASQAPSSSMASSATASPKATTSSPSSASTSQPASSSAQSASSSQMTSMASSSMSSSAMPSSSSSSSSSALSSSMPTLAEATTSPTPTSAHRTLSGNTTLMVFVIVGSIVGASIVLFGLAWLCRRSNMGPKRKSRGKFYTGNWSPRSGTSDFSYGAETTQLFGSRKGLLEVMRPSPMPSLKPDRGAAPLNRGQSQLGYNYGSNFDLDLVAPHKLRTPAIQPATPVGLTLTGSAPNVNGRGWALFDQPLETVEEVVSEKDSSSHSAKELAPNDNEKLYVVNASDAASDIEQQRGIVARRPTFLQRVFEQPGRAGATDLHDRISKSEKSYSSRSESGNEPSGQQSLPVSLSTSNINNKDGTGLLSTLSSMRMLAARARGNSHRNSAAPEDSDFEGTIGAPDKEIPRASRMRKGQRMACDGTSSESCSDDDASTLRESDSPALPQVAAAALRPPLGQGYLWFDGHGTPRTPGLAGVGASWARASAQLARYPDLPCPPQAAMSSLAVGRPLSGAPGMPPPRGRSSESVPQTLASLKRQQALIDDAEQRQRAAIPQEGNPALSSRIATWWQNSWDAEWPSPTLSAAQQAQFVAEILVSPRCTEPLSDSSSPLGSLEDNTVTTDDEGPSGSSSGSSTISSIEWTSQESDAETLRGEAEIKHWEHHSLQRAQADLLRMGSLRPRFMPTTTLDSWLHADSPKLAGLAEAQSPSTVYEGSLKTPVMDSEESEYECATPIMMRHQDSMKSMRSKFSVRTTDTDAYGGAPGLQW